MIYVLKCLIDDPRSLIPIIVRLTNVLGCWDSKRSLNVAFKFKKAMWLSPSSMFLKHPIQVHAALKPKRKLDSED